jgi:hypothetical protein
VEGTETEPRSLSLTLNPLFENKGREKECRRSEEKVETKEEGVV